MILDNLDLINFRSHEHSTLRLTARTYIVGENNSGKSTVFDAIAWVLTGHCRGLDGASREISELVREGQTTGLGARLTIRDFGRVQRQTNGREVFLVVNNWEGSNAKQQEALFEKLGTTEPVLQACLDSGAFLNLHHSDAKRLIMGILHVQISEQALKPFGIDGPLSLEQLEARYQSFFNERRVERTRLSQTIVHPAPSLDAFGGETPPPAEDLKVQLNAVRREHIAMSIETGEGRGKAGAFRTQREALLRSIAEIERRTPAAGEEKLNDELDALDERLALMTDGEPATQPSLIDVTASEPPGPAEEYAKIQIKLADERGRLRMITELVERVGGHNPEKGCVLQGSIPCKTPAKEFSQYLKETKQDRKAVEASITAAEARIAALQKEIDALAKTEREQRASDELKLGERQTLERRRGQIKSDLTRLQDDRARLADLRGQLASVDTALANLGTVESNPDLDALQERITRGEQLLRDVEAYERADAAHHSSLSGKIAQEKRVERLEKICDALGPKGLIVDVLEAARSTFEAKVNSALSRWGYALEFQIDPWTVRVNGRKANQLSVSERLRVGVALQLAIAEITGLWLVGIDAADTLDGKQREILGDVIEGWPGQVIMAATKDPGFALPDAAPEGVMVYKFTNQSGATAVASVGTPPLVVVA